MKETEEIKVFIRIEQGVTACICSRSGKRCRQKCQPDIVSRDKFQGWEKIADRDRFGKCELDYRGR